MILAAIDPGLTGAIAIFDDGTLRAVVDMPVVDKLVSASLLTDIVCTHGVQAAIIEQVGAMPGQGVSSMFKFGRTVGVVEGVLAAMSVSVAWATPAAWKRGAGLNKDKGHSRRMAIERWPQHAALFARAKDDGRAEAALLGAWWLERAVAA